MPALMSTLQDVIPSSNRQFYAADAQLEIADCYLEGPCTAMLPLYFDKFYNRLEREVRHTFAEVMAARYPSAAGMIFPRYAKVDWRTFLRSDFYNLVVRPSGMVQGINLRLRENGRPVAALNLFRSEREPAFASCDLALLDALQGFIAHGLREGLDEECFVDTEDRSLIIVSAEGKLLHLSTEGQRLLSMALVARWSPDTARQLRLEGHPEVVHLCRTLVSIHAGNLPGGPPAIRRRNAWGEFVMRAYWLDPMRVGGPERLVGIVIDRREPRSLGLLHKVEALSLTEREKDVCLLLVHDHGTANIARAMNLAESTVITHRRHIYQKLGVGSRSALIDRLNHGSL